MSSWGCPLSEINLKTSIEVARIQKSASILEDLLIALSEKIDKGVSVMDIDRFADEFIIQKGARSALKGYKGFPNAVCVSLNNIAAHGIPGEYLLLNDDLLTVDVTLEYNGWYADAAWTYLVGQGDRDLKRLIKAAWQSTMAGINIAKAGNRIGDVGEAIQKTAKSFGCSVLDDYAGHGIGRDLHEDPLILNMGEAHTGLPIVPGMVFTIEPIISLGDNEVEILEDGWSIKTMDGSITAQFEHTIAIFSNRTEILTFRNGSAEKHIDFPPFF
jgi:methionyl aminopeptidase